MSEESKPYIIDENTKVKLNFPEVESPYAAEEAAETMKASFRGTIVVRFDLN